MSDSTGEFWSNDPNAPQITTFEYIAEKSNFVGILIGAMFYGTSTDASVPPRSLCLLDYHSTRGRYRSVFPMYGRVTHSRRFLK